MRNVVAEEGRRGNACTASSATSASRATAVVQRIASSTRRTGSPASTISAPASRTFSTTSTGRCATWPSGWRRAAHRPRSSSSTPTRTLAAAATTRAPAAAAASGSTATAPTERLASRSISSAAPFPRARVRGEPNGRKPDRRVTRRDRNDHRTSPSTSLPRRCSMYLEAFAQAKPQGVLQRWGQILGTGCWMLGKPSYATEATKKAICWPFKSPLTDSNRRPPPYHGGALPTELRGQRGGF